jgi:hypothetical protein
MFHHHLLLLSRAALLLRHATGLSHAAISLIEGNLGRLGLSLPRFRRQSQGALVARGDKPTRDRKRRANSPLLIHYHIFKNAGTSFEWALAQVLGAKYRSLDTQHSHGFISAGDLVDFSFRHPEVTAISSHQAAPPPPRIFGREIFTSILIRDPIARIRSIYAFERAQGTSNPGAVKARELSFREYVEWRLETSPIAICNFQVNFCSRTSSNFGPPPGPAQLEQAIANLDSMSIVGTVVRFDEWLALAQNTLSTALPAFTLPAVRLNATSEGRPSESEIFEKLVEEVGEETAKHLLENNKLDMCLHQVADALLTRRLAERGVKVTLLQAYKSELEGRPATLQVI